MIDNEKLLSLHLISMKRVYAFTLDQLVSINGILGYVEFIGVDETVLINNMGILHIIKNIEIKIVYSNEVVRDIDDSVYYVKKIPS